jgi:hypothetical protein
VETNRVSRGIHHRVPVEGSGRIKYFRAQIGVVHRGVDRAIEGMS